MQNTIKHTAGLGLPSSNNKRSRSRNRIFLWVYDSLLLVVVWLSILALHPSVADSFPTGSVVFCLILAFALFSTARLLLKVYKQILRYGSVDAYFREITATVLASVAYTLLSRLAPVVPSVLQVAICGIYITLSLFYRMAYYYIYRLAQGDTPMQHKLRWMLVHFSWVNFDSRYEGGLMRLALKPTNSSQISKSETRDAVDSPADAREGKEGFQ